MPVFAVCGGFHFRKQQKGKDIIMRKTAVQIRKMMKSENVHEMISSTPDNFIEFLAFIPLFFLMSVPLEQLISNFLFPDLQITSYAVKYESIRTMAVILVPVSVLIMLYKRYVSGRPVTTGKILREVPAAGFFGFVILMIIVSTAVNGFTREALYGNYYRQESAFTFIMYFSVYFASGMMIKNKTFRAVIQYTFILSSVPVGVYALIAYIRVRIAGLVAGYEVSAVFHQSNHYGYYILMVILQCSVLFVTERKLPAKSVCMAVFTLNTAVLVINNTFGCLIACLLGLVFNCIVISVSKRTFSRPAAAVTGVFLLTVLVMSLFVDTVYYSFIGLFREIKNAAETPENAGEIGTGRGILWSNTLNYIKEKPFSGFGTEGIGERLAEDSGNLNNRPHNEFMQYAAFYGIPAAAAYICGVFSVYLKALEKRTKLDKYTIAALVSAFGYLVSSFFGNTMYYTAPYLFVFLGMGCVI